MLALLLAALLPPAPAAEPEPDVPLPTGAAPLIVKAKVEGGRLVSTMTVTRTVNTMQTVQTNVGGVVTTRTVMTAVPRSQTVTRSWDLDKATVTNAAGAKVDIDTFRKRLKDDVLIVVSADGKPVDKGYLALLRKDALVVVAPPAAQEGVAVPRPILRPRPVPVPVPAPAPAVELPPAPPVE